jgi:hypothetical protein
MFDDGKAHKKWGWGEAAGLAYHLHVGVTIDKWGVKLMQTWEPNS